MTSHAHGEFCVNVLIIPDSVGFSLFALSVRTTIFPGPLSADESGSPVVPQPVFILPASVSEFSYTFSLSSVGSKPLKVL